MNYRLLFNLFINIIGAFVLVVLILISVFSNVEKRKTAYFFLWSLVSALIPTLVAIACYAARFSSETPGFVLKLLGSVLFVTMYAAAYAFMLYVLDFIALPKKVRRIVNSINGLIGIGFSIFVIVGSFTDLFFNTNIENGISLLKTSVSFIPYIYIWYLFLVEIVFLIIAKGLKAGEKIAFLSFISVPTIALVFHVIYPELSIFTFAIIASFLSLFLYFYVQRGLMIQQQEKELSEKQIELTISQIRPHFIYNCLSSISYLCTKDPEQAVEAIDNFSQFLRVNLSNISQNKIVPFTQELEHTMKYLKLEKMRFEDRVRVYFDIRANDFEIPSLTLQPLVENAIKHGICKRAEGGTIVVKTSETDKEYLVEVTDDGVGFDPKVPPDDGRVHVGLTNVERRLKSMVNGKLEIYSKIGKGTRMSIHIPKKGE